MNCVNEETLQRYLDGDMTEKETEALSSHLSECNKCIEELMTAAVSDKELLDRLKKAERTAIPLPQRDGCINSRMLMAYIADALPKDQINIVESHLEICDTCLARMTALQRNYLKGVEMDFDTSALAAAMQEKYVYVPADDILTISLEDIGRQLFEVIKTTGMILKTRFSAEAVRGAGRPQSVDKVHIRKDFAGKEVSAEVTIRKGDGPESYNIKLSLMKMKGNDVTGVLKSANIHIKGDGIDKSDVTDKNGELEFKDLSAGNYRMVLDNGIALDVEIKKR